MTLQDANTLREHDHVRMNHLLGCVIAVWDYGCKSVTIEWLRESNGYVSRMSR